MSTDIYFNIASWFPGNVRIKPHFYTQWRGGGSVKDYFLAVQVQVILSQNGISNFLLQIKALVEVPYDNVVQIVRTMVETIPALPIPKFERLLKFEVDMNNNESMI